MTDARRDLSQGHVAEAAHAARRRYPGFTWITAPAVSNGRYWIDHDTTTVYIDGRQTPNDAAEALLDAIDELARTSGLAEVIPLQARGLSGRFLAAIRSR